MHPSQGDAPEHESRLASYQHWNLGQSCPRPHHLPLQFIANALTCTWAAHPLPPHPLPFAPIFAGRLVPPVVCLQVCATTSTANLKTDQTCSFFWLVCWYRAGAAARSRVWHLFGRFSALSCIGCCSGTVAWMANMQGLLIYYETDNAPYMSTPQRLDQYAASYVWVAIFFVCYGVEVCCLLSAKLLVADRLFEHVMKGTTPLYRTGLL